jgi:DNA-binding NarL/FixJ family response regulator
MTIRIALVEDHPVVVDGLVAALRDRPDIEVVGSAGTIADARRLVATVDCDVVLLDLRLPDGSGIDLLREAGTKESGPAFLVLSSFLTPEYVAAAFALGASGFLLKTSPTDEILGVVREIAAGRLAFTPDQLRASRSAAWAPLTGREHDVLEGLMRGRSNDELAADLGVSRKTVESYITRLLARYGVTTRTELALLVERGQILDLPVRDPARRPGAARP